MNINHIYHIQFMNYPKREIPFSENIVVLLWLHIVSRAPMVGSKGSCNVSTSIVLAIRKSKHWKSANTCRTVCFRKLKLDHWGRGTKGTFISNHSKSFAFIRNHSESLGHVLITFWNCTLNQITNTNFMQFTKNQNSPFLRLSWVLLWLHILGSAPMVGCKGSCNVS